MPKILTTAELAKYLRLTQERIREYRHMEHQNPALRGVLLPRGFRLGDRGHWRYRSDDIEAWLAERTKQALVEACANTAEDQSA